MTSRAVTCRRRRLEPSRWPQHRIGHPFLVARRSGGTAQARRAAHGLAQCIQVGRGHNSSFSLAIELVSFMSRPDELTKVSDCGDGALGLPRWWCEDHWPFNSFIGRGFPAYQGQVGRLSYAPMGAACLGCARRLLHFSAAAHTSVPPPVQFWRPPRNELDRNAHSKLNRYTSGAGGPRKPLQQQRQMRVLVMVVLRWWCRLGVFVGSGPEVRVGGLAVVTRRTELGC